MSNVIVTELIIDARGAEAGSARHQRAMQAAQAAVDRMIDREERLAVASEKASIAMTGGATSVGRVAAQYQRLAAAADPAIAAGQKIAAAQVQIDAAVRRGITTQTEASRILDLYSSRMNGSAQAARELQREQEALARQDVGNIALVERHLENIAREAANLTRTYDPLIAAQERYNQSVDQANRLARQSMISEETRRTAIAASQRAMEAAGAPRGDRTSNVQRGLDLASTVRHSGLSARDSASVFEADARAMDAMTASAARLRAEIDPLGAAQARLRVELASYEEMASRHVITTDEMTAFSGHARAEFEKTASSLKPVEGVVRLTNHQVTNLGYQLNDVATMLAMGASPFQIISSQAGQVVQALGDGPGGVRGSLQAIGGAAKTGALAAAAAIGPLGFAFIGVTTAAAAFAFIMRDRIPDATETMEDHSRILDQVAKRYDGIAEVLAQIDRRSTIGIEIELGANTNDLREVMQAQMRTLELEFIGANRFAGMAAYGGVDSSQIPALAQFEPIRKMVEDFRAELRDGEPDVEGFMLALKAAYDAAGDDQEMRRAIEVTQELAKQLAGTALALDKNAAAADGSAQALARYNSAMSDLASLAPDVRTNAERINEALNDALAAAGDDAGAGLAARWKASLGLAADTAGALDRLADARAGRAAVGMSDEAKAIADINRQYELSARAYRGNADALQALTEARDLEIGAVREQSSLDAAQKATDYRDAIDEQSRSISDQVDALRRQTDMFGQSEGAIAAVEFRTRALAEAYALARENNQIVTPGQIADIEAAASEIGSLTDQVRALREEEQRREQISDTLADLQFESSLFGLSEREQQIERQLRQLKLSHADFDGQRIAGQMRYNASLEETQEQLEKQRQLVENVASTFLDIFTDNSSDSFFDRILNGLADISRQFAEVGKQRLLDMFSGGNLGYTTGQPAPGQRSVAAPGFPAGAAAYRSDVVAPAAAAVSGQVLTYAGRFNSAVDGRLMTILETAAKRFPLQVEAISGLRTGDRRFHGKGLAADIQIYGANGQKYGNYQNAGDFRIYEQFAQEARRAQQELFPELDKLFRWGGYFSGGKGRYGALDSMHFDLGGAGMGGGSWQNGLTANQRRLWAGAESVGMGGSANALRLAVRDGSLDATRAVASGQMGFTSSVPIPTARPGGAMGMPAQGGAASGGMTGVLGGVRNFLQSPAGMGAMNGLSAFGAGMESGSPIGGAMSGALGAFGMGLGPVGIGIGLVGGLLGGLFGRSKRKKEERRQRQEQERQQMLQAQQQLDQQLPAILELQDTLLDRASGTLTKEKARIEGQLKQYAQLAATAKNQTEIDRLASMQANLGDYMERLYDQLRLTAGSVAQSMAAGRGLEPEFAKAVAAVREQSLGIRNYLADLVAATGAGSAAVSQATVAGRQQLLRQMSGAEEVSEIWTAMDKLSGTAAQLGTELQKLGMNADEAAGAIRDHLSRGIQRLRDDFVQGIADETADGMGMGYLPQIRQLLERRDTMRADATSVGADPALVDRWFGVQARNILDQAGLLDEALAPLVKAFPDLAAVLGDSSAKIERSLADAENDLRTAYQRVRAFADQLAAFRDDIKLDRNLTTLGPQERLLEAQNRFRSVAEKAAAGDAEAQGELIGLSRSYLDEAKSYYASSEAYYAAFNEVQNILASTEAKALAEIDLAKSQYGALLKLDESVLTIPAALAAMDAAQAARDTAQAQMLEAYVKALAPQAAIPSYQSPNVSVTPGGAAPAPLPTPAAPSPVENVSLWNGSSSQNYVGNWKDIYGRRIFVPSGWSDDQAFQLFVKNQGAPMQAGPGFAFNEKRLGGLIGHGFNGLGYQRGGIVANGIWDHDSVTARHRDGGEVWLAGGEGILTAPAMRMPGVRDFMEAANANRLPGVRMPAAPFMASAGADNRGIEARIDRLERTVREVGNQIARMTAAVGAETVAAVKLGTRATREQAGIVEREAATAGRRG